MNLIATKKGSAEHPSPMHGQLADKPDPERNSRRSAAISLHAVISPAHPAAAWLIRIAPVLDRLLGIRTLDRLYRRHHLQGLNPFEFAEQALDALDISLSPAGAIQDIPARGPLLVVCNHPYGGVEALALMHTLRSVRTDIKFLANTGLQVFRELQPHFIATNPLRVTQKNLSSIRQCEAHLTGGGVLVMFPAGKVSTRPRGGTRIADAPWNRLVGHLAHRTGAALLPVFFHGANGRLFHILGGVWERSKLLMLPREFLRLRGQRVRFEVGRAIPADVWRHLDTNALTRYARLMTYLLEASPESVGSPAAASPPTAPAPLAPLGAPARIAAELSALPGAQRLLDYKQFSVFYAAAAQIPMLMADIARERERVFRLYDEGSGQPRDGDAYDETYVQLFVWDNQARTLVGAYRMGRADALREPGAGGLYLTQMFEFDAAFYDAHPPALEMGRSFVVPEYQKHYASLYLLWQGIGRYLAAFPRYRRLYGTVSLSRQYDDRAIALICDALIEPSPYVRPRHTLRTGLHPEWGTFAAALRESDCAGFDLPSLSTCVRGIDREGKDLPILLKHYYKLGARFHCVGVDPHFNDTPGLLLSVDMDAMPEKLISTFLGEHAAAYLARITTSK